MKSAQSPKPYSNQALGATLARNATVLFCIGILGVLAYANSLGNPFLYDDIRNLQDNRFITSWEHLPTVFSRDYFKAFKELSYRPVGTLLLFLNHSLCGKDPAGHRAIVLLLHILCSGLIYVLSESLFKNRLKSLIAALLFVSHPVHTEVIAVVTFNEDILASLFYILAVILYRMARCSTARAFALYGLSLGAYFLALFSKEVAITLPLMLLILDHFDRRSETTTYQGAISRHAGYWLLTISYLWFRFVFFRYQGEIALTQFLGGSPYANLLTMLKVLALYYPKLLIWPVQLSPVYDFVPISRSFSEPGVALAGLLSAIVLYGLYRLRTKAPEIVFCLSWILITLLPVLNIVPFLKRDLLAERYLYLPSVGYCLLLPIALEGLLSRFSKRTALRVLSVLLIVCYLAATVKRNTDWKTGVALWTKTIEDHPGSARAHLVLATELLQRQDYSNAILSALKAIELDPSYSEAYNTLAISHERMGRFADAVLAYQQAIRLNPNFLSVAVRHNLAGLYIQRGMLDEALIETRAALDLDADDFHSNLDLCVISVRRGRAGYETANEACQRALHLNPEDVDTRFNLAVVYQLRGKPYDAVREYNEVLRRNPGYQLARDNLTALLHQLKTSSPR